MKRAEAEKVMDYLDREVRSLSRLSYQELEQMQFRKDIDSPPELSEYRFAREIKPDEFGGLEVSVFHYFYDQSEVPDYIKEAVGDIEIKIGESQLSNWFNILPNGEIEWPDFEHPEGKD